MASFLWGIRPSKILDQGAFPEFSCTVGKDFHSSGGVSMAFFVNR